MSMISVIIWVAIMIAVLVSAYGRGQKQEKTGKSSAYVPKPQLMEKKSSSNVQRPVTLASSSKTSNTNKTYSDPMKQKQGGKKGERMPALRLYEGDPVPKGYRMVNCSYCGAENLVPYSSRQPYMCYFCHEDL